MPKMKDGSKEFIGACLKALNVSSPVESWTTTPSRSHYFTDYASPKEAWKDRWQRAWTVRIKLTEPEQGTHRKLERLPIRIDELDSTWTGHEVEDRHDTTALVNSTHIAEPDKMDSVRQQILKDIKTINTIEPTVSLATFTPNQHQLRMLFHPVQFPDWIPIGDQILSLCQQNGGIVNYRKLSVEG